MLKTPALVMRRTVCHLVLLVVAAAVPTALASAERPPEVNDQSDATKTSADDAKPAGGAPLATALPSELLMMLMNSIEGQRELDLSEDQKVKAKYAQVGLQLPRDADPREYHTSERQKKRDEAANMLREMLSPEQTARLRQLELQWLGIVALTMPDVVSALGITDQQREKLQALRSTAQEKMAKPGEELRGLPKDRNLSSEERQARTAALRNQLKQSGKEWADAALAVLTPEQRGKFENMKGAKIELVFHSVPHTTQEWMRLVDLLWRQAALQGDLELTDDQFDQVDKVWVSLQRPGLDPLEREKANDQAIKTVQSILSPGQITRLKQLDLQLQLNFAAPHRLMMDDMVSALGITDAQKKQLEAVTSRYAEKMRSLSAAGKMPRERQTMWEQRKERAQAERLLDEELEAATAILTPQQREKFANMTGPKCEKLLHWTGPPDRLWLLLVGAYSTVQDNLKLSDDQKDKLKVVWQSIQLPPGTDARHHERKMAAAAKAVEEMLSPAQAARLKEINIQWLSIEHPAAHVLIESGVASALGLTEAQQKELATIDAKYYEELRALDAAKGNQEPRETKKEQLRKGATEKAMALLTPQQREQFEKMKGVRFEWPARRKQR